MEFSTTSFPIENELGKSNITMLDFKIGVANSNIAFDSMKVETKRKESGGANEPPAKKQKSAKDAHLPAKLNLPFQLTSFVCSFICFCTPSFVHCDLFFVNAEFFWAERKNSKNCIESL